MNNYNANPTKVINITQSGELPPVTNKHVDFLPAVNRTESLSRFFSGSIDQLLSSGSTASINANWGRLTTKSRLADQEVFVPEVTADRANYQFAPGTTLRRGGVAENTTTYVATLNRLAGIGSDMSNHDKLFSEPGYVLDLPINSDMFSNYGNYYWLEGNMPVIELEPTLADPIDIDSIINLSEYTTPVLSNGKTVAFINGLRVVFVGDNVTSTSGNYIAGYSYYVENVGGRNISLVAATSDVGKDLFPNIFPYSVLQPEGWDTVDWDTTPWDNLGGFDDYDAATTYNRDDLTANRTYIVMGRHATDMNPWTRSNRWFSSQAIIAMSSYNNVVVEAYLNSVTRAIRPIIEFNANLELMNTCETFVELVDYAVSAETITDIIGGNFEYKIEGETNYLADGDIILVTSDAGTPISISEFSSAFSEAYASSITTYTADSYVISGVGSTIVITPLTTYSANEYAIVKSGIDTGTIYCYDGTSWTIGQSKQFKSTAPLFMLYSDDLTSLVDFESSDFVGSEIFSYKTSEFNGFDRELGFSPSFSGKAAFNDFDFEFDLGGTQHYYNITDQTSDLIPGLYYFRNKNTDEFFNGWSNIRGNQRVPIVMTTISDGLTDIVFNVDTSGAKLPLSYTVSMEDDKFRWASQSPLDLTDLGCANPDIIIRGEVDYSFNIIIADSSDNIEFVDPYGNVNANISTTPTSTGITFSALAGYPYNKIRYQSTLDNSVYGELVISDENHYRISVTKNNQDLKSGYDYDIASDSVSITTNHEVNDVFVLHMVTDSDMTRAVYEVAPVHFYNSNNDIFYGGNYSTLKHHISAQLRSLPGYSDDGDTNNYHKIRRINQFGGSIRQQIIPTAKFQFLNDNETINPSKGLAVVSADYSAFKRHFKNKVAQLWETRQFETIREIVDTALTDINIGKNSDFKYAHSDMVYFRNHTETEFSVADATMVFMLDHTQNKFGNIQNHIQIWLNEYDGSGAYYTRPLINDVDYSINGNEISLTSAVELNGSSDPATLTIRYYMHNELSHVPMSSVKLGFFRPTTVEIIDGILIGHDGAEYDLIGTNYLDMSSVDFDIRAAALYDLELRIANNLTPEYNTGADMNSYLPSPNRSFAYANSDLNSRLDDWYNRYALRNSLEEIKSGDVYSVSDEFSWNYSSVYPYIGGWRGVYSFYFGTTRPHSHPWEMLGHYTKPTWWDANYSWATGVKRTALLNALKNGIVGDPSDGFIVDIAYNRNAYDWATNTLVTTSGVLNDPVTANVTASPSAIDASRDLVFGDWGTIEHKWRISSEYKFALAEALLQLKPYRIHGTFWEIGQTVKNNLVTQTQIVNYDTKTRRPVSEIHNENITNGIISKITVTNGGSGYVSPTLTFTQLDSGAVSASARVLTNSGIVTGVEITDPGRGFLRAPTATVIEDSAGSGATITMTLDFEFSTSRFGFGAIASELFSIDCNETSDLSEILQSLSTEFSIHIGGYTDDRIMNLEFNGGSSTGTSQIPQDDYDIVIGSSGPLKSVFFSGVKITKDASIGYTVTGYDLDGMSFYMKTPSRSGSTIEESISGTSLIRYSKFQNSITKVPYGSIITKRQELFNFLLGLGEYYKSIGIVCGDNWLDSAKDAIEWALTDATDPYYMGGLSDVLVYEQGPFGTVQSLLMNYSSNANILDKSFKAIDKSEIVVLRNDETTEFSCKSTSVEIFGLRITTVAYEHIISIKNETTFGDVIYSPVNGLAQNKIKFIGERSANWSGKVEAPGYLVNATGLMLNMESSVREIEHDWINSETKALDRLTRQTLGFNVGYNKPTYLVGTGISDVSAYRFEKGKRAYQGTASALTALGRNKNIFGTEFASEVNEDWMIRIGEYGDVSASNPLQFELNTSLIKSDSQQFRFSDQFITDNPSDLIIDIYEGGPGAISGNFNKPFSTYPIVPASNSSILDLEITQNFNKDAGLPLVDEIDYFLASVDDINSVFDLTAAYALVPNWNASSAYHRGDIVRYAGNVHELNITSSGLTPVAEGITLRGTQVYPIVVSGATLMFNNDIIEFSKNANIDDELPILVTGTVINPSIPSGSTLTVDGININLIKTTSSTVFSDIVFQGNVTFPTIVNSNSAEFTISYANSVGATLIDTVVAFNELSDTKTMQKILIDALGTAGIVSSTVYANQIISTMSSLQTAYISATTVGDWETFVSTYYSSGAIDRTFNPEILGDAITASPGSTWETAARAVIDSDLELIELLSGNAATETQASIVSGSLNNSAQFDIDRDAANTLLDATLTVNDDNVNLADLIAFIKTNGGINIAAGEEITVSVPTEYVTDVLSAIIIKINTALVNAGIADIVADAYENSVRLTRSTVSSGYRLGASENSFLGFVVADADVVASGSIITVGVALNVAESVIAINNAAVTGISAISSNNKLEIISINSRLTISDTAVLSLFGLPYGVFDASIATSIILVDLTISDVVQQINAAALTNLSASQIEGALIITYDAATLVIDNGTANSSLGIASGTYTSSTDAIENIFTASDWLTVVEPANFNIWVIDNIGSNPSPQNVTNQYNVYQTIDFGSGITEVCAGNENGDDAMISCTNAHTLSEDEYVLILNSSTVPSIDGIHKVTGVKNDYKFFIDRYIDENGYLGKVIPVRTMRFANSSSMETAIASTKYVSDNGGIISDQYMFVDDVEVAGQSTGAGAVYSITRSNNNATPVIVRNETPKTINSTLKNVVLFSDATNETISILEVIDPLKGIISGAADKEIDIRNEVDIAGYNATTDSAKNLNYANSWGKTQVGMVWWDLSNAIYLNYDQGSDNYRQAHWGELFPTSTIDVYEWTKSPATPDEYEALGAIGSIVDGIELTGVPYSTTDRNGDTQYYWAEELHLNNKNNQIETFYYFWVKNKTTVPDSSRTYSISQLTDVILDPTSNGISWCAASSDSTLLVSDLAEIIGYDDLILQVNFKKTDVNYHQEFILLSDTDQRTVIPEWLHMSVRDSLAGFSRIETIEEFTVYDPGKSYTPTDLVKAGDYYFKCHTSSLGNDPLLDTDSDFWTTSAIKEVNPAGYHIENDMVTLVRNLPVPDMRLHEHVRYGIAISPRQTWFVDVEEARHVAVDKLNSQLLTINLVDSGIEWLTALSKTIGSDMQDVDIIDYWNFHDWEDANIAFDKIHATYRINSKADLLLLDPQEDEIAMVLTSNDPDLMNRKSAYIFKNGAWQIIFKENATIQFTDVLWSGELSQTGWDTTPWDTTPWDNNPGNTFFEIINEFYETIWTGQFSHMYTEFWFHMAKYVMQEQNDVDWIFKSSYISYVASTQLNDQSSEFSNHKLDELFDYIQISKPFRTKLRDAYIKSLSADSVPTSVRDAIEIRIQTNPVDSTINETTTRSFRLDIGNDGNHYSSQIVNEHKKFLGADVGPDDTIIPILNLGLGTLPEASGAIWVNGERIEYGDIFSETLDISTLLEDVTMTLDDSTLGAGDGIGVIVESSSNSIFDAIDPASGHCVDYDGTVEAGPLAATLIYADYTNSDLSVYVAQYENLDKVTYILNQDYSGPGYTRSEIQDAIWYLTDGTFTIFQPNVAAIVDDAELNGVGFVAGPGDLIGILICPTQVDLSDYQNAIYGIDYSLLTTSWMLAHPILLVDCVRATHGTFNKMHSFTDVVEDVSNLEFDIPLVLSEFGNSLNSAWSVPNESLLSATNTDLIGTDIRNESFGTIDLYGNDIIVQIFAANLLPDALETLKNEVSEFIEVYWATV